MDTQLPYMKTLGCLPGTYINSGFLVMNLQLLRKDNLVDRFMEALHTGHLQFPDQDVLNMVCKGRILGLPPYYNGIRTFYLPQYKSNFMKYYTQADWQTLQAYGTIHYTGAKPWETFTIQFSEWWKWYDRLSQTIKSEWQVNKRMYVISRIYNTRLGRFIIDACITTYRLLKYGKEVVR